VITSDSYRDARDNRSVRGPVHRVAEWLEFHLMVGVEHFFIFDNSRSDCAEGRCSALHDVLRPYISAGTVSYLFWPAPLCDAHFEGQSAWRRWGPQIAAFNSCLGRFAAMTRWMALHDVDEFLAPTLPEHHSIADVLRAVRRRVGPQRFAALNSIGFAQKLLLNCSNLRERPRAEYERPNKMGSVWSRYQCVSRTLEPKNKKLLVRPLRMRAALIHFPTFFYPPHVLHEYILNDTAEGLMYHARDSGAAFKKNDFFVLPPDENLLRWIDRLHSRLAAQRIAAAMPTH